MIEYLDEIETEFENTLACLSGAQMGSNHEKKGGRKSRDTLPLRKKCGHSGISVDLALFVLFYTTNFKKNLNSILF